MSEDTSRIFGNEKFVESLHNALGEYGILVAQLGESDTIDSVPDSYWNDGIMENFFSSLEDVGFESVLEYEEMHGRVAAPMRFVAALNSRYCRARWFSSEAELSLRLHKRIVKTVGGEMPLRQFDAATMIQYMLPSRAAEERFCKGFPDYCGSPQDVFVSGVKDHPISSFEVGTSSAGGGRGVFTKEHIAKGDYLSLDECVNQMFVPPTVGELIYSIQRKNVGAFWEVLVGGYLEGYGLQDSYFVSLIGAFLPSKLVQSEPISRISFYLFTGRTIYHG